MVVCGKIITSLDQEYKMVTIRSKNNYECAQKQNFMVSVLTSLQQV